MPDSAPAVTRPRSDATGFCARLAVIAAFLAVYGWLQYDNCVAKSATFDEPLHLTAGYLALHQIEHRLDPTHPPLLRLWAALPLLGQPMPYVDMTGITKFTINEWTSRAYSIARQFVFGRGKGDEFMTRGRLMIAVFGVLLGLLIFSWADDWLGFGPAAMALGFYTIEPNLMAHSGLVTTDAGVVCLMFGAVYFAWRLQRRWTGFNLAGLAAFTALAVVSKFSALILLVLLPLLLAVAVWSRPAFTWRRALVALASTAAFTVFAIWAVYGFRYSAGPAGAGLIKSAAAPVVKHQLPQLADAAAWIDSLHVLPNAFSQGLAWSLASAQALGGYLNGELSTEGWWYYFPVAFLVKTPIAEMILAAAGLVFLCRRGTRQEWVDRVFLLVPPALFLVVAMGSHINIGLRHILPLYPYVLLLGAVPIYEFLRLRRPAGWLAVGVSAAASLFLFARAWPVTIAYFNEFVGGPENGYLYLSDSNLDWGQHLKELNQWMQREKIDRINLAYFGSVDPASYGIYCTYLPGCPPVARTHPPQLPGYVAISSTLLTGRYELLYGGFMDLPPVAVIGNTIRVYWVEQWPEPDSDPPDALTATWHRALADQLLTETHWYGRAAFHYRLYLQARERDSTGWFRLGFALLENDQTRAAVEAFVRAVDCDPAPKKLCRRIAETLLRAHRSAEAEPFARAAGG